MAKKRGGKHKSKLLNSKEIQENIKTLRSTRIKNKLEKSKRKKNNLT